MEQRSQIRPVQIHFKDIREMVDLSIKIDLKYFIAKLLQDRVIFHEDGEDLSDQAEDTRAS